MYTIILTTKIFQGMKTLKFPPANTFLLQGSTENEFFRRKKLFYRKLYESWGNYWRCQTPVYGDFFLGHTIPNFLCYLYWMLGGFMLWHDTVTTARCGGTFSFSQNFNYLSYSSVWKLSLLNPPCNIPSESSWHQEVSNHHIFCVASNDALLSITI